VNSEGGTGVDVCFPRPPHGLRVLLCSVACAFAAAPAGAAQARGLLSGLHVPLACANPANHGLVGKPLGAARGLVGGQMRCFAQAIGCEQGSLGPKIT